MSIYALEIGYFSSDQGEILVPHLHGFKPNKPVPPSSQWTRERFFEDAQNRNLSDQVISIMQELLEWCEEEASRVFWGMGKQTGSFTFHYMKGTKSYSLFSVYSDGKIAINFGWLREAMPSEMVSQFWNSLQLIEGISKMRVKDDFNCWPSAKLGDVFRAAEEMEKFKSTMLNFRDRITNL